MFINAFKQFTARTIQNVTLISATLAVSAAAAKPGIQATEAAGRNLKDQAPSSISHPRAIPH